MRHAVLLALAACGSSAAGVAPDDAAGSADASRPLDSPPQFDAAAPPDARTCGLRVHTAGLSHRTAHVAGLDRTYLVYLPASAATSTPIPLVVVYHGYTMSGQSMVDVTQYQQIADDEHIALAFPDGQAGPNSLGAPWNVGDAVCPSSFQITPTAPGDDFAFLDHMKADVDADQCVDFDHVYVTGFSMGGYFTHQVGCNRDDVRAIAPHSGGTHDLSACPTGHKPVIIFHGTSDPVVPNGCDDPHGNTPSGYTASATSWAAHNGCAATTTIANVGGGQCAYYDGCPSDGQVVLCTFNNMGHCWAGGPSSSGLYACPSYAQATRLEWDFFKHYAW